MLFVCRVAIESDPHFLFSHCSDLVPIFFALPPSSQWCLSNNLYRDWILLTAASSEEFEPCSPAASSYHAEEKRCQLVQIALLVHRPSSGPHSLIDPVLLYEIDCVVQPNQHVKIATLSTF